MKTVIHRLAGDGRLIIPKLRRLAYKHISKASVVIQ